MIFKTFQCFQRPSCLPLSRQNHSNGYNVVISRPDNDVVTQNGQRLFPQEICLFGKELYVFQLRLFLAYSWHTQKSRVALNTPNKLSWAVRSLCRNRIFFLSVLANRKRKSSKHVKQIRNEKYTVLQKVIIPIK